MNKYYLYRHIRLDKNIPFYIGIGGSSNYNRAYSKKGRNKYWINIVNITKYRVDILFDNLSFDKAIDKEIEFISLYGRIDLNKGTLVNMTDGGEGLSGFKFSPETIQKLKLMNIGKILSDETKKKISNSKKGQTQSEEFKTNMSKRVTGNKYRLNKKHTEYSKLKMSNKRKGKKHTEETKEKLRLINIGKKMDKLGVRISANKHIGNKHTEETKLKMSISQKNRVNRNTGNPKLSEHQVKLIIDELNILSDKELSIKYNVNSRTINRIRNKKTWIYLF